MATVHGTIQNHAAFIWSVADLLRGDYKQSEYGKVILPLTVLRRLDCVLEPTKAQVLDRYEQLRDKVDNLEPVLQRAAGGQFYNTSLYDFGTLSPVFDGTGGRHEPEEEPLSKIIEQINERFGTNFDPTDKLFFDAVADKLVRRPEIQQQAAVNSPENFALVLKQEFEGGVIDQMAAAEDLTIKYLDNLELQAHVLAAYAPLIQGRAKIAHQEHCPLVELLGPDRESAHLEYKATLRTHADGGELCKPLETASLKTIAAFLNSRDGGTLLVGVADDGTVHGLDSDYVTLHKPGHDDRDRFQQHLANILSASVGEAAATNVRPAIQHVDGHDVCRIQIDPCAFPVDAKVLHDRNGQYSQQIQFFVRIANGTKALDPDERQKYVTGRWP